MKPGINIPCISNRILGALLFSAILFFNGCSDTNTGPAVTNTEVSYMSTSDGLVDGGLQIDSAKILIKDIRFGIGTDSNTITNFRVGTYVLHLNMANTVRLVADAYVAPATYVRSSFEVHQAASANEAPDPDFFDGSIGYSVVVMGSYNGTQFKFKSQLDVREMMMMLTPVTITTDAVSNITLSVNPYKWFISGGGYLDPTLSVNTPVINANIQGNIGGGFSMYKDTNKDGNPD
jgi:hypothetical protein